MNGSDSFLNESLSKAVPSELAGPSISKSIINNFKTGSSSSQNQFNKALSQISIGITSKTPKEDSLLDKEIKTDFDNSELALNSILQSENSMNLDNNMKSLKLMS